MIFFGWPPVSQPPRSNFDIGSETEFEECLRHIEGLAETWRKEGKPNLFFVAGSEPRERSWDQAE